jgi:hypothetical protein
MMVLRQLFLPAQRERTTNADKANRSKENQKPKVAKIPSPQR